jgi:hypothetical protein
MVSDKKDGIIVLYIVALALTRAFMAEISARLPDFPRERASRMPNQVQLTLQMTLP